MSDPLEGLFVDEETINKELLYETLKPFIGIIKQSKEYSFTSEFNSLEPKQKIIVFLLGQKAKKVLKLIDEEKTTPKVIASQIGLKEGTVYPYVREMEKEFIRNEGGKYFIPNYALEQTKKFLTKSEVAESDK